jgi:N-acetylmuramoyl-L-alanine amidase
VVKGSVVNIRQGPGTTYKVVTQTKAGEVFTVLEHSGSWLKVRLHNGQDGWISKDYLVVNTVEKQVKVNGTNINVRKGPGTGYATIGKVQSGLLLSVYEVKNNWYRVNVPGIGQAWIAGWLTTQTTQTTTPANNTPTTPGTTPGTTSSSGQGTITVTGSIVNVRQQNRIDAPVVTKVNAGERLVVLGKQGDWYQVRLADGSSGWIADWLAIPDNGTVPSRSISESDVLIAPIAEGKTFKIVDTGTRPILVLEGWNSSEYKISTRPETNTIVLELQGPSERNYEGKLTRLGINNIKIYPQADKAIIELAFAYSITQSVSYNENLKLARIQVGTAESKQLSGKVIVLDPGHASIQSGGWLDPGAVGSATGLKEKDVNLSIVFKLKTLLEADGARVILTHAGQTSLSLAERAGVANNISADIFVSIHANFSDRNNISGHSTYFYAPSGDTVLGSQRFSRQKLATLVQREMVSAGGRNDLGVLQERFAVLRETTVPSILVETAFLSDRTEESLLASDAYRQKLAEGIYNGIKAYFQ